MHRIFPGNNQYLLIRKRLMPVARIPVQILRVALCVGVCAGRVVLMGSCAVVTGRMVTVGGLSVVVGMKVERAVCGVVVGISITAGAFLE
jgi:hypothetical protein